MERVNAAEPKAFFSSDSKLALLRLHCAHISAVLFFFCCSLRLSFVIAVLYPFQHFSAKCGSLVFGIFLCFFYLSSFILFFVSKTNRNDSRHCTSSMWTQEQRWIIMGIDSTARFVILFTSNANTNRSLCCGCCCCCCDWPLLMWGDGCYIGMV